MAWHKDLETNVQQYWKFRPWYLSCKKYHYTRYTAILVLSLLSHAGIADVWNRVISGICNYLYVCVCALKAQEAQLKQGLADHTAKTAVSVAI